MRSRTIREGSVGLLILAGIGLFGLLLIWLQGLNIGARSYRIIAEFANVGGMQSGAPVRYRGVNIGRILAVRPGPNAVEVEVEISSAAVLIPRTVLVEANQSGLISETSIDITPLQELPTAEITTNPLAPDCENSPILCDGSRVQGEIGVSFDALIRSTVELTALLTDPVFFNDVRILTRNTSEAAAGIAVLSREVTGLTQIVSGEVTNLTGAVQQDLGTISSAAAASATSIGQAANQIELTAAEVNSLLVTNRGALVGTLTTISDTSVQLQQVVGRLSPTLASFEEGQILQNLEILSANAAQASVTFRTLSEAFGSPENIILLQQTLDSARATFQNAQKITADLDELTGDPAFRRNLRDLVDGLSGLVSSTEQLQRQTQIAQTLEPVAIAFRQNQGEVDAATFSQQYEQFRVLSSDPRFRMRSLESSPRQRALSSRPNPDSDNQTSN